MLDEREITILTEAISAFRQRTGLSLVTSDEIDSSHAIGTELYLEGYISLQAEVKKGVLGNIGAVIRRLQKLGSKKGILITPYIPPPQAEKLKLASIQFIDTAGNAFICQPQCFVYVQGYKAAKVRETAELKGKAFKAAGLKLVFALMQKEELLNAPYRNIAAYADVALATTGAVLEDLEEQNFLNTLKKGQRKFINKGRLIRKWGESYPALQKKIYIGTFTTDIPIDPQGINLSVLGGQWGGEVAAARYTNYLNPKDISVFVQNNKLRDVMSGLRLRKLKSGEHPDYRIDLYHVFWNGLLGTELTCVPPLLVYAELVASGDLRNIETAQRIYEQYLD
ncbi:type IV toxin-antitoxin system AbiEi family antitoxin [Parendozoicomonas haliclonae]|uniref:Uncharacterized protein n=1 Tax=Parendozoicomonas haliclonae TaxID=1960125 RepID=A0A1X7ANK9_9GAMM|nr:type IV toxin-antitoxin system AbiEi family antitoxin [Parendozoicomonas haliclonae]SMA48523.1 hypothetical protein EHSB41UT_02779 [Parendozoicomonas haliclonae]